MLPIDPEGSLFLPEKPTVDEYYQAFVSFMYDSYKLLQSAQEHHPNSFFRFVDKLRFALLQDRNINAGESDDSTEKKMYYLGHLIISTFRKLVVL